MYPDTKNNILLYRSGRYSISNGSLPTAFTVNGTIVNRLSGRLCMPNMYDYFMPYNFNSSNTYYSPVCGCYIARSAGGGILTDRISTPEPLQAGLVLGKTVVFPKLYSYNNANYYATIQMKVGLLHADGSITYIASSTSLTIYNNSGDNFQGGRDWAWGNSGRYKKIENEVIKTSGVITQEGDYVIAEMIITPPSTGTTALWLGRGQEMNTTMPLEVFQISID